ncbi:MAG TPA: acyltransferase domain-containing protein, partial [Ktedonobacteraceae bacterium]|nr:acyltransferase domain-containing protein [Ktedonobacteraceae bacterium]
GPYVLLLSAKTPTALEQMTARFTRHMAGHPELDLADVAATLQMGRSVFPYRRFLVAQNSQEIQDAGEDWISGEQHQRDQPVAFLFPGQGSLLVGRGAELYQSEPVFRQTFNRCAEILRPYLDLDIHMLLHPPSERKAQIEELWQETACAQPLQFVLSYALAQLWQQRGVCPQMMLGHSLGEYVAACLAGVFSLEDALRLIACRGALMQKMPVGAMLSVALSPEATQERLMPGLEIAALNGEELTVVSGPRALVEEWRRQLGAENIVCQPLHVTRAFHSALLDPMLPPFLQEMRQIKLHEPRIPYISNLSGTWITASQATDPGYWGEQLRKPVQFLRGLQTLQEMPPAALLEVGPGTSLTGLARRYQQRTQSTRRPALVASMPHPKDTRHERAVLLEAAGQLWLAGVSLKWEEFAGSQWQRVCLPTYPFERHAFWHKAGASHSQTARQTPPGQASPLSLREATPIQLSEESGQTEISYASQIEEIIAAVWSDLIGVSPVERDADFF